MTDWVPALASFPGPRYLAFVSALEADIGAGRVNNNASAQFGLEGGSRAIANNGRGSDTTVVGAGIRTVF